MKCKKCGTKISNKDKTCPRCGTEITNSGKKANIVAIIGLIVAIIGMFSGRWTYCIIPLVGLILNIVGLIRSKVCLSGKSLSIAGIIISALSLAAWLLVIIISLVLMSA